MHSTEFTKHTNYENPASLLPETLKEALEICDFVIIYGPPTVGKDVAVGKLVEKQDFLAKAVGDYLETDAFRIAEGETGVDNSLSVLSFKEYRDYYVRTKFDLIYLPEAAVYLDHSLAQAIDKQGLNFLNFTLEDIDIDEVVGKAVNSFVERIKMLKEVGFEGRLVVSVANRSRHNSVLEKVYALYIDEILKRLVGQDYIDENKVGIINIGRWNEQELINLMSSYEGADEISDEVKEALLMFSFGSPWLIDLLYLHPNRSWEDIFTMMLSANSLEKFIDLLPRGIEDLVEILTKPGQESWSDEVKKVYLGLRKGLFNALSNLPKEYCSDEDCSIEEYVNARLARFLYIFANSELSSV